MPIVATVLKLTSGAALPVGTTAGTVAAGDDSRIVGAAQKSANLSDLASSSTARINLGLGNAAVLNVGIIAGTVAAGDDSRFISDSDKGDITVTGSGATWTIDAGVVANSKLANMSTATFKGRATAATGVPEDLTVAQAKTLLDLAGSNTGDQTITLTGDVTGTGTGTFAATIAADAVSNAKLANMSTATFKGRATAGTGDPEDLTTTQATALIDAFTSTLKGLAPASGGGTINFLRADGTWVPATVADGDKGDITVTASGATWTIDATAVTNAKLADVPTATFKGRTTAATGVPEDLTAAQATALLNPATSTLKGLAPASGGGTVNFLRADLTWAAPASGSGGIVPPQGRLTLVTATPVMASSQSAIATVFYTPYVGNQVPIWSGSAFVSTTFTELSQATTDTTKSPAAVAASSNYDVFVWSDGGTIRATRGPAWTSATARGTGAGTTELSRVQGFLTNAVAITNGPAAGFGTYVGTIRSNAASTIDFILGGAAAGGTAAVLNVWNTYNRVSVGPAVYDNTSSWTLATVNTTRAANASNTNRISFVLGLDEDCVPSTYNCQFTVPTGSLSFAMVGPGLDSTTTMDIRYFGQHETSSTAGMAGGVSHVYPPMLGSHFIQALELSSGATATFFGGGAFANHTMALYATLMM
jgi:hypothetical protein